MSLLVCVLHCQGLRPFASPNLSHCAAGYVLSSQCPMSAAKLTAALCIPAPDFEPMRHSIMSRDTATTLHAAQQALRRAEDKYRAAMAKAGELQACRRICLPSFQLLNSVAAASAAASVDTSAPVLLTRALAARNPQQPQASSATRLVCAGQQGEAGPRWRSHKNLSIQSASHAGKAPSAHGVLACGRL